MNTFMVKFLLCIILLIPHSQATFGKHTRKIFNKFVEPILGHAVDQILHFKPVAPYVKPTMHHDSHHHHQHHHQSKHHYPPHYGGGGLYHGFQGEYGYEGYGYGYDGYGGFGHGYDGFGHGYDGFGHGYDGLGHGIDGFGGYADGFHGFHSL